MTSTKLLQQTFGLALVVLLLTACTGAPAQPTATPTPIPPTPTPTPVPPTATPAPILGIGAPLTIEGVQLQVSSATKQDTYTMPGGMQTFTPYSTEDECMIVEATIDTNDSERVQSWEVSITDENGRQSNLSFSSTTIYESGQGNTIMWLFVVAKASRSFTLHLPGEQTVELDTLLPPSSTSESGQVSTITWNGVPIMPQATEGEDVGDMYAFTVDTTVAAVQDYYEEEMPKMGWELLEIDESENLTLIFQKEGKIIFIEAIAQGDNLTQVLLVQK